MKIAGIDYSLTSPAVCIHSGKNWNYANCRFFYLTGNKKFEIAHSNLSGMLHLPYFSNQERYHNISSWVLQHLNNHDVNDVYLEDYAYAATGLVFQIGENTGILKDRLWKNKTAVTTVPPPVIKKFATGKGNANKELIQQQFIKETGVDIKQVLGMTPSQWNPSSDIIDSYYICKYGFEQQK